MTDTDTIPVSATTASTGKGIRHIGSGYWGAWSGIVSVADTETTLLETFIPNKNLKAICQIAYAEDSGDNVMYKYYYNEQVIYQYLRVDLVTPSDGLGTVILIPKLTRFKVTAENLSTTTGRNQIIAITAKEI